MTDSNNNTADNSANAGNAAKWTTGPRRVSLQGTVVSDKQQKTISVRIDRTVKHELYKKYVKRSSKVAAHDEKNEAREGDVVEVVFSRPLSKNKRWSFVRVVKAGPATIAAMAEEGAS